MGYLFLSTLPDGRLAILDICSDGAFSKDRRLAKTMFELSRDGSDMDSHFDQSVHTLKEIAKGIPGHVPLICRACDDIDLPDEQKDRGTKFTLRDAWEDSGTAIRVNMSKARLIHMDRIRRDRDIELERESRSEFRQPAEIEALFTSERQARLRALRDIPQTFDLTGYTTPEALKAAWPVELPRLSE